MAAGTAVTAVLPLAGGVALLICTVSGARSVMPAPVLATRSVMPATMLTSRTPRAGHGTTFRFLQPRHIVEQAASLLVGHEADSNRRHGASRGAELIEKGIERESRAGESRPKSSSGSGSVTGGTSRGHVQVGVRDRGPFGQRRPGEESGLKSQRALGP